MITSNKIRYSETVRIVWKWFAICLAVYLFLPAGLSVFKWKFLSAIGYVISISVSLYLWYKHNQNSLFTKYVMDGHRTMPLHGVATFGAWMAILLLFLPTIINFIVALRMMPKIKWQTIVYTLIVGLAAGICEEIIFRGYMFSGFLSFFKKTQHPLLFGGLTTALFFGLTHFVNLTHQSLNATLTQAIVVSYLSLLIVIVRIYTNSIYIGMLYHAMQDFSVILITHGNLSSPASGSALPYVFVGAMIGIILFMQVLRGMDNQMRLFRREGVKPSDYNENNDNEDMFDENDRIR